MIDACYELPTSDRNISTRLFLLADAAPIDFY